MTGLGKRTGLGQLLRTTPLHRAVVALGFTQIIGWGSLLYAMTVLAPSMAHEFGVSLSWILGAFTGGLVVSGLVAKAVGRGLDRLGGRFVMAVGSALVALALAVISWSPNMAVFALGWLMAGLGMAAVLYDAAFTSLGQVSGARLRTAITAVTLFGGFASTVFWPLSYALNGALGWRATMIIYASINLLICVPLHWSLPVQEGHSKASPVEADQPSPVQVCVSEQHWKPVAIAWMALSFACGAIVFSALSVHLMTTLQSGGLTGAEAVFVAVLIGPMQVVGRVVEFAGGNRLRATTIGGISMAVMCISLLLLTLVQKPGYTAIGFAVLYGASNGVLTIVRGTVPAEVFGRERYGELLGKLAGPSFIGKALAPLSFAVIVDMLGPRPAVYALLSVSLLAWLAYGMALRQQR